MSEKPDSDQGATATPRTPRQEEMPFAIVYGDPVTELPRDLYIPPDALEVFLEAFEGPLDLLLYLIRRHNLDILDIPIAEITRQYMEYIDLMKELRLELAAEYLVMAAMLAEIKSRMLLPRHEEIADENDPRAELMRHLQEYEQYKEAAESLGELPQVGRDVFEVTADSSAVPNQRVEPEVTIQELIFALKDVMERAELFSHHHVQREPLSVRERMSNILASLSGVTFTEFTRLFTPEEGRLGVVVSLLAVLELLREALIEMVQGKTVWTDSREGHQCMNEDRLKIIVEAALLAAGRAMTVDHLIDLFASDADKPERVAVRAALETLEQEWRERALELVQVSSGYRFQVRSEYSQWMQRLWMERPSRCSRALLETLAIIAYRQPVTRGEIEDIRGVGVSSSIVKTLLEREWIRVLGHREVPGRPAMYGTTKAFLDHFSLKSLDSLPPLNEIRDLERIHADLFIAAEDSEHPAQESVQH